LRYAYSPFGISVKVDVLEPAVKVPAWSVADIVTVSAVLLVTLIGRTTTGAVNVIEAPVRLVVAVPVTPIYAVMAVPDHVVKLFPN
jgi:hypothetical protein